ncbi:hypothetical protein Acsp06_04070 [Actinomycetospora sp. NBRC 106375]|uniref:hypothetical protein n=1 Tax=Actinomycetospora sp. NBRC 106375 TaxID=3032207 RepID=UPI0024A606DB|nr:hypothetical protein [Actinomycetospora sp. NBRC 106375]GLZ44222.1 hypothetical protein Acsp06_04070 [Actinomycetospora sp. NBRC 106375]
MKVVLWILAGIGAVVLIGGVVLPVVHWLLGAALWLLPAALIVGGGIWLARRGKDPQRVSAPDKPQQLG